ncbi:hypothetical protein PENSPDRAFT_392345 [Peniophora sp. CONT]|nr:hypothetical protein PENSPDRAFT_392345 [Peniophora sp. CONT]
MSVSKTGLVAGQLTAPPGGGPRGGLARRPSGTVPLSLLFKVESEHAEHLYNTLVDRKLKSIAWKDFPNKMMTHFSISQEPARLDFVDGRNAFELSSSEKARRVAEGVDKASDPGDEQPIGDEIAFASEALPGPSKLHRAQPELKQPRAKSPLPSLTAKLTQVTTPGSTPGLAPAPAPAVSPGPYIESPPSTSPAKPPNTRLPSFSSKFTDLLTKANSNASKPTSGTSKPDSSKSKAVPSTSAKGGATLPKNPSITQEDWVNSSQEKRAEYLDDLFGKSDSISEVSDISDDDSIPEPARMRARKAAQAHEKEKEKSKGNAKAGRAGLRVVDSNDAPPPAPSTRKRKAADVSEHGGSPPERRSPRLSQAAAVEEDVPMVDEPAPIMSPARIPTFIAQDAPAPSAEVKKPRPRPKGKAATAATKVADDAEDESDPPAPAPKKATKASKKADALASASDTSPPGASKKTPAQEKPTGAKAKAPAAPKKKVKPPPPPPPLVEPDAEPRTRPTRASAAAASKKIAHDAGVLNQPTQSSSPSGEGNGSSSTAVEGHRARSAASASAEPELTKPTASRTKRKAEAEDSSSSPPAAPSARGKRKRDEEVLPTSEASTSRAPKRRLGEPKTPAAPPQPKDKAPPARPTKPAARKYGARGTDKDKGKDKPSSEANFDAIPGSSPKSPLEEMLAQTRGPRSSSPAPLSVAGPSKIGAMRGKGVGAKEVVKTADVEQAKEVGVEGSGAKREVKRLPRRTAVQRASHLSPVVESEHTDDVEAAATAQARARGALASKTPAPESSRASAPPSHDVFDDVDMLDAQLHEPAVAVEAASVEVTTSKLTREPSAVQRVAPEFDFGESSPPSDETSTAGPLTRAGRSSRQAAAQDADVADIFEDDTVSEQAPATSRNPKVTRASLKDNAMDEETLYDDVDMLDATITVSPPRISAAAKGKARLSSPVTEVVTDVADAFDVDFEFGFGEAQEPALDTAQEDVKSSDKSSSSSSYREKYTDITLPLKGEKEDSAPPFDVYMSCEDVPALPSFDEGPEERVAIRNRKSVAFADAEPEPEIRQKPQARLITYVQREPATGTHPVSILYSMLTVYVAPRASTSSSRLSPIRIDHIVPQQERPHLFQHKAAKVVTQAQPRRSGPPRRVPIKARAPVVVEEQQPEQEPKDRVLDILDEIHAIVKAKIRTGFDGVDQRVINMRNRFLRQAADDIRAQLPDYIATYNELLALHEAYSAFAVRKQMAISHAEQLANEGVRQVKEIIRAHDIRANEMARNRPVMPPLPASVAKWLT